MNLDPAAGARPGSRGSGTSVCQPAKGEERRGGTVALRPAPLPTSSSAVERKHDRLENRMERLLREEIARNAGFV